MSDEITKRLANLSPEARSRVEAALKNAIDTEVSNSALARPNMPNAMFSRGVLFSRVTSSLATHGDDVMLKDMASLDDAQFSKLAERLSQIKNIKPGGGQ